MVNLHVSIKNNTLTDRPCQKVWSAMAKQAIFEGGLIQSDFFTIKTLWQRLKYSPKIERGEATMQSGPYNSRNEARAVRRGNFSSVFGEGGFKCCLVAN